MPEELSEEDIQELVVLLDAANHFDYYELYTAISKAPRRFELVD
jgi:hypothetical protein